MRLATTIAVALLIASAGGCALCDNTFDDHHAAYGGSRARRDMVHGRVSSVFDPADAVEPARAPGVQDRDDATDDGPESPQEMLPAGSDTVYENEQDLPRALEQFLSNTVSLAPEPQPDKR